MIRPELETTVERVRAAGFTVACFPDGGKLRVISSCGDDSISFSCEDGREAQAEAATSLLTWARAAKPGAFAAAPN